jgi:integrase/recombinase XerD
MVGSGQAPAGSEGAARGVNLGSVDGLLAGYCRYLLVERKLEPSTVSGYACRVRPFLVGTAVPGGLDLAGLTSADVYAFLLADGRRRTRRSAKTTVTALRSLLRFLHGRGVIGEALAEGVPSVAQWRLTGVPQHLEPDQVEALFDACDRGTVTGLRAFAVLKLMARLGLRRCEVARLQLDDIDWRAGEIVIRGKRSRRDRLRYRTTWGRRWPIICSAAARPSWRIGTCS